MRIVDGSDFCSPQFSSEEHKVQGITNSTYMAWQYKDQTILGWIISPHYLLRWFPPFMALKLLVLLGKPLVHVLLHHQLLEFLLSSES
jgi:hypothetical protein